MMRYVLVFIMLATASVALAQGQTEETTRQRKPRTRQEFLHQHGTNDTAIAIINVFFNRQRLPRIARYGTVVGGVVTLGLYSLIKSIDFPGDDFGTLILELFIQGAIAVPGVLTATITVVGVGTTLVTLPQTIRNNKRNLQKVLDGEKYLTKAQWQAVQRWMTKH